MKEFEEDLRLRLFWRTLTPEQRQAVLARFVSEEESLVVFCHGVSFNRLVEQGIIADALEELPPKVYFRIARLPVAMSVEDKLADLLGD